MSLEDMVQLHVFYRDDGKVDLGAFRAHLRDLIGPVAQPVLVLTPIPAFFYPGVEVEIDAIAVADMGSRRTAAGGGSSFPAGARAGAVVIAQAWSERQPDQSGTPSLRENTGAAINRLAATLDGLGATLRDLCKVTLYLSGVGQDAGVAERLLAARLPGTAPVVTTVPLPRLSRPEPQVHIEGFALSNPDGVEIPRQAYRSLPADRGGPPQGLRCGDLIFAGGQLALDERGVTARRGDLADQTHEAMASLCRTLRNFGADFGNLVKVNTFYLGAGTPEELHTNLEIRSGYYVAPGPASTGMPVPVLHRPGAMISVDAIAALDCRDSHGAGRGAPRA